MVGRIDGAATVLAYQRLRRPGEPAPATLVRRFGSWADAVRAAGLEPPGGRRRPRRWERDELVEALAAWVGRVDRPTRVAYVASIAAGEELPSVHAIIRAFATWRGAVATAQTRSALSAASNRPSRAQ